MRLAEVGLSGYRNTEFWACKGARHPWRGLRCILHFLRSAPGNPAGVAAYEIARTAMGKQLVAAVTVIVRTSLPYVSEYLSHIFPTALIHLHILGDPIRWTGAGLPRIRGALGMMGCWLDRMLCHFLIPTFTLTSTCSVLCCGVPREVTPSGAGLCPDRLLLTDQHTAFLAAYVIPFDRSVPIH